MNPSSESQSRIGAGAQLILTSSTTGTFPGLTAPVSSFASDRASLQMQQWLISRSHALYCDMCMLIRLGRGSGDPSYYEQ